MQSTSRRGVRRVGPSSSSSRWSAAGRAWPRSAVNHLLSLNAAEMTTSQEKYTVSQAQVKGQTQTTTRPRWPAGWEPIADLDQGHLMRGRGSGPPWTQRAEPPSGGWTKMEPASEGRSNPPPQSLCCLTGPRWSERRDAGVTAPESGSDFSPILE